MRLLLFLFAFYSLTLAADTQIRDTLPVCEYDIVNRYPHDPQAFTQGLLFHNGFLYESTGLYGQSSLRKVALETGEVLQQVDLDRQYFGEGLTLWDDRLIQLTWRENTAFVYDLETFEVLETFRYNTEGWGITRYQDQLIMSDGSQYLYYIAYPQLQPLRKTPVIVDCCQVTNINEMEIINDELWVNIWKEDRIARVDPVTGKIKSWVDFSALRFEIGLNNSQAVLNGIAHDPETGRIFVTGKLWNTLFEVRLGACY